MVRKYITVVEDFSKFKQIIYIFADRQQQIMERLAAFNVADHDSIIDPFYSYHQGNSSFN